MIRSGQEDKVQNLLAMIRANASMASISATIEAGVKGLEASQKRKRSVSSSTSPKDRTDAGDSTGDTIPEVGASRSEAATSNSASQSAPHWIPSPNDSIGITDLTLVSSDQPQPELGPEQVRIFVRALTNPAHF